MSLNPLNELKRRLHDDSTPLPKRLCLAKNLVQSHHFPAGPKERIISEWIDELSNENKISKDELKNILEWLTNVDDLTSELKIKIIQIVSKYVQQNVLENTDINLIIIFIENAKVSPQLSQHIDEYLTITTTLLNQLRTFEKFTEKAKQILRNHIKYYKESRKKLEFITKFVNGENLEVVFDYLDVTREAVIEVCQTILFPLTKKSYFISYLQTLIRKDNLYKWIEEKGDNVQSVIKIMETFFEFPTNRTENDYKFLCNYIDVFVSCFRTDSQIVFAFYIMIANILKMNQDYITASMTMKEITLDEKIKRNVFLKMVEIIQNNDIDVTIRLTDTFGVKISKVELKKNFLIFLQHVMIGQLKIGTKTDKVTLQIIMAALKLDPSIVENKLEEILPPLMAIKKNSFKDTYIEMINCLLEILFKLSHGNLFITQILPFVRKHLEASNTEQIELRTKINGGDDCEKLKNKVVYGSDVFPDECVDFYGKLTTELMFRQNKELLESLQKDFMENCLVLLEEGDTSPSVIVMTEFLSAILSSLLSYSKMADHTVPQHVAQEYWTLFDNFQNDCLKRFGECVLKLKEQSLLLPFLKLCQSYSQLKLLNIRYSNFKLKLSPYDESNVFDLSLLIPSLKSEQWSQIAETVKDTEEVYVLDNLIVLKTIALKLIAIEDPNQESNQLSESNTHLVKQFTTNSNQVINIQTLNSLNKTQCKQLAKSFVKLYLNDEPTFDVASIKNKNLLNAVVVETLKNITKNFDNCDSLTKGLAKTDFDMVAFVNSVDIKQFFINISMTEENDNIKKCIDLLKLLKLPFLVKNIQLATMFVLMALKKCSQSKKTKKTIDYIFLNIFELSLNPPDLYQIFPVDFIFDFKEELLLNILKIKVKNVNQLFIIKSLIESATKRVKRGNETTTKIVDLLLKKKHTDSSFEIFSDTAFQITCLVLPVIVKQKKATNTSAPRAILIDLQEKLQKVLLDTFEKIDFKVFDAGNTGLEENSEDMAALNAISAYSLTLSKFCESNEGELKDIDCLWSGLTFFVECSITTINSATSKSNHIESSLQLLTIILRHIKKLETHTIFDKKDNLLTKIWQSILNRLKLIFQDGGQLKCTYLDEISVLIKFLCELVSVETFSSKFVPDLDNLVVFRIPSQIIKDESNVDFKNNNVAKYLWCQCLKANTAGPKCGALTRIIYQKCKNLKSWLRQHYDSVASSKKRKLNVYETDVVRKIDDKICEMIKINLDLLSEVVLASKKITLDYKFLDAIFELQHMVHHILNFNTNGVKFELGWHSFFGLYEGSVAILNSLLVSREELLEDRWPCYMQCYRALTWILCNNATSETVIERNIEDKLAETAHSIEKLTQSISKRKKQVSRISAYTVADICTYLERKAPSKMVRQHLENSVAMLLQASDSSYAMAFLKRSLAGAIGQITLNNLYLVYKRYYKYVGNS